MIPAPPKFAPGPCPACGDRLVRAEIKPAPNAPVMEQRCAETPHFRCTGCRTVFSMDPDFTLTVCEAPEAHVMPVVARNLEAEARELRERYFPTGGRRPPKVA